MQTRTATRGQAAALAETMLPIELVDHVLGVLGLGGAPADLARVACSSKTLAMAAVRRG